MGQRLLLHVSKVDPGSQGPCLPPVVTMNFLPGAEMTLITPRASSPHPNQQRPQEEVQSQPGLAVSHGMAMGPGPSDQRTRVAFGNSMREQENSGISGAGK